MSELDELKVGNGWRYQCWSCGHQVTTGASLPGQTFIKMGGEMFQYYLGHGKTKTHPKKPSKKCTTVDFRTYPGTD